jgi:RNA polymerase sigma factor (sigma-70 family)
VPKCHVLILSAYSDDERVAQALEAGASGYLLKNADTSELTNAIRAVHAGERYLAPEVEHDLLTTSSTAVSALTEREREVLQLIAEGMSNSEIAEELTLSIKTVEVHRANVMHKLQGPSHTDVIRYAIRGGLLGLEMPPPLT